MIITWFIGSSAKNMGNTNAWKPGDANPRQYYEENGEYLKSITKTIDGISYTFDDLGNVIQDKNEGGWHSKDQYELESGLYLKNMWYQIDKNWYFFDKKGSAQKLKFIKVNGEKYFMDEHGKMCTESFRTGRYRYCAGANGELLVDAHFEWEGVTYETNSLGHASEIKGTIEFVPSPRFMWEGEVYAIDKPAYFFEEQFTVLGEVEEVAEEYPRGDGEAIGITKGSNIYSKNEPNDLLYIKDEAENAFYSYSKTAVY